MADKLSLRIHDTIPAAWKALLDDQVAMPYFQRLAKFVDGERAQHEVYPPAELVFESLRLTAPENVRVLILGQDPYHGPEQAHGLSFSVQRGVKIPPSLRNIFQELQSDIGCEPPEHGCLESWAEQGVLMLNTVLTVRAAEANSHRKQGWESLTDWMIEVVDSLPQPIVFVLWGSPAKKKRKLILADRHLVIESAHPSPLSAYRGFFGSKPFSQVNEFLAAKGQTEIDWQVG